VDARSFRARASVRVRRAWRFPLSPYGTARWANGQTRRRTEPKSLAQLTPRLGGSVCATTETTALCYGSARFRNCNRFFGLRFEPSRRHRGSPTQDHRTSLILVHRTRERIEGFQNDKRSTRRRINPNRKKRKDKKKISVPTLYACAYRRRQYQHLLSTKHGLKLYAVCVTVTNPNEPAH